MKRKMGKVYLVGAGPGDPKLISLKGLECIREAEVVVHDYLASPRLLVHARPDAEIIYVGKSGSKHMMEQDEINALLVKKAREGKVVVRLKGGDPFIFGRGGEEALELAKNGIPFEVIPGISSAYAVPAYAGIPVTHRGLASTVAFVTGHEDPTKLDSDIDWEKLATGVGTIIFLMGVRNLLLIVEQLIRHGRGGDTPIALIRWGTTPRQQTLTGTLGDIVEKARKASFKPPAIIVVGEVVSLREKLSWFEKRPLFGKRILVTRSRTQTSELVAALEELGAEVVEFPTIKIIPPTSYGELDTAIKKILGTRHPTPDIRPIYDWLIFTSVNGVSRFFERLRFLGGDARDLKGVKLAAIGSATAGELKKMGLKVDYVPDEYRAEAVVEGFREMGVKGLRVFIPRAKEAREILPQKLREMGAEVETVVAYETVIDSTSAGKARELLERREVDVIIFTSSSTVRNFVDLLKGVNLSRVLDGVKIACIGPITAKTAEELGLKVDVVAKEYTIKGLVRAIASSYQPGNG
ncbi:MAG: uroporphyrinogen-III C-methyltransferase [Actinomycetota bacterium]|nr:uroporphyrinogen-III C-methyltransferase [Actinomycetota bacterium]